LHLSRLPSGLWRVAVKHNGLRRTATAATRAEVIAKGAEMLLELGGKPKDSPTVAELVAAHLAASGLSPTTLADYRSVAERLPGAFGARTVADVTPAIVEALYGQFARTGMSPHRIGRVHDLLSGAWRRAIRWEWAVRNPCAAAHRPTRDTHEIVPPTPTEVAALIAAAPAGFADYLRLAASTGARRSELVALQWDDIDLDRSQIAIRRSLVYTKASGVVERATKTGRKGHRTIAIGLPTAAALRRLRSRQLELALAAGVTPLWVFSSTAGARPWGPTYPTLAFGRARSRAGLEHVRLHDLRHFVATQMLAAGHSVAQVAARLGQTQTATTHRYSHWIPATDRDAAAALEALIQ
jgi:integrase